VFSGQTGKKLHAEQCNPTEGLGKCLRTEKNSTSKEGKIKSCGKTKTE